MRNFYKGQKVVCIHDGFMGQQKGNAFPGFDLDGLKKGNVYTIRWVGEVKIFDTRYVGIQVEEILRDCWKKMDPGLVAYAKARLDITFDSDLPFHSDRFAPLVKTDISVFTAMLNPMEQLEEVE